MSEQNRGKRSGKPKRWAAILAVLAATLLFPLNSASAADSKLTQGVSPMACSELVLDGGFEDQGAIWTESSTGGYNLISNFHPRTGSWGAYLGGTNNADDRLSQQIILPSNAISVSLAAWWSIATEELNVGFDRMTVSVLQPNGTLLGDLFTIDSSAAVNQWNQAEADLTQYAGQTVVLRFRATTNASSPTDFYVDDVSVVACSSAVTRIYLPIVMRKGE